MLLQATAALHDQLRHANFQLYDSSPRMLPRIYNPVRLDVDCSNKTPAKAPPVKSGRGVAAVGALLRELSPAYSVRSEFFGVFLSQCVPQNCIHAV